MFLQQKSPPEQKCFRYMKRNIRGEKPLQPIPLEESQPLEEDSQIIQIYYMQILKHLHTQRSSVASSCELRKRLQEWRNLERNISLILNFLVLSHFLDTSTLTTVLKSQLGFILIKMLLKPKNVVALPCIGKTINLSHLVTSNLS